MIEDHRHAGVHFGDEIVGLGDDHRARRQRLAAHSVFPRIPQPDEGERLAVGAREIVGLLAAGFVLPFIVARGWDQAARALESVAEERFGLDRLRRALNITTRSSLSGFDHHRGARPHRMRMKSHLRLAG